jgi:hypothetical protein
MNGKQLALLGGGVALAALLLRPSGPQGAFIIGGKLVPVAAPVLPWTETGMVFSGLRSRTSTSGVLLHFSGSPAATPASTYRTLVQRGLSVHLALGKDGTFYQFCDLNARCVHANEANNTFIGIEISGDGNYSAAQVKSLFAALPVILQAYDLPWQVPMSGGDVATRVLPWASLASFRGILGHYMVSGDKVDPGVALMRAVAARNPGLVPVVG